MRTPSRLPPLFWLMVFAVGYGLLTIFSIDLHDPASHFTYVRPASGLLLAVLLLSPTVRWPVWLLAASLINIVLASQDVVPLSHTLLYTVGQLISLSGTAWAIRTICSERKCLDDLRSSIWFIALVWAGAVVGGFLSALCLSKIDPSIDFTVNWRAYSVSQAVGCLLTTPFVLAWANFRIHRSGGLNTPNLLIGLACYLLLIASCIYVFDVYIPYRFIGSVGYGLTYLPLPFLVLVALAWGARGSTLALLTLALITVLMTHAGVGPFASFDSMVGESRLEEQAYLTAAALMTILLTALRLSHERVLHESAEWKERFEDALLMSHHLAYELNPETEQIEWGGDVSKAFGYPAQTIATLDDFLAKVHADDRERVAQLFAARCKGVVSERSEHYRLFCKDGKVRAVSDTGSPVIYFEGEVYRVDGLLHLRSELV